MTAKSRAASRWRRLQEIDELTVLFGILAVLPLILVEVGMTYRARLLVLFLIFAILAVALDIVFGQTDQLFLFVGALAGLGAYVTALPAEATGLSPWFFVPASGLVAGTLGLLVSYVAARREMTIIVIAILTLSLQLGFMQFFVGARDITGGSTGFAFSGLEVPVLTDALGLSSRVGTYYLLLVFLAVVLLLYRRLMTTKYGLAFKSIRQDEIAAESAGINVIRYKVIAGLIAATIIGLVGPFYAQSEFYVIPRMFAFQSVDVLVLIMLVLGGMRTLLGPVVGAGVIIYLNESLHGAGQWRLPIFGALLIVLFLHFREGLVPRGQELWQSDTTARYVESLRERWPDR